MRRNLLLTIPSANILMLFLFTVFYQNSISSISIAILIVMYFLSIFNFIVFFRILIILEKNSPIAVTPTNIKEEINLKNINLDFEDIKNAGSLS